MYRLVKAVLHKESKFPLTHKEQLTNASMEDIGTTRSTTLGPPGALVAPNALIVGACKFLKYFSTTCG